MLHAPAYDPLRTVVTHGDVASRGENAAVDAEMGGPHDRHRVSEYRQDKAAVGYPGDVSASSDGCHESGGGWFGHQAINLDTQDIP